MIKKLINLSFITLTALSSTVVLADNFYCPKPSEIRSTNFTSPSIWVAPAVPGAAQDTVGVGLGGEQVREFLGANEAQIGGKAGWVCVYRSKGGMSVNEYESKVLEVTMKNQYLRKYFSKINAEFEKAEPYLKDYPKDKPIGFVGYQLEENYNKKK